MSELHEMMERCRELHGPWLADRGEDVQISLLTADELSATVVSTGEDAARIGGDNEQATRLLPNSTGQRRNMLPPIVNDDPGDDNDHLTSVSWDG